MALRRFFLLLAAAFAVGVAVLAVTLSRVGELERLPPDAASARFESIRDSLGPSDPILSVAPDGGLALRPPPTSAPVTRTRVLEVMAYRGAQRSLVRVEIPFWFLRMKAPAVDLVLRDTGLSMKDLGLAPGELVRYGPAILLDEERPNGDRVLVWTR